MKLALVELEFKPNKALKAKSFNYISYIIQMLLNETSGNIIKYISAILPLFFMPIYLPTHTNTHTHTHTARKTEQALISPKRTIRNSHSGEGLQAISSFLTLASPSSVHLIVLLILTLEISKTQYLQSC
jgi:hypothetical protein